MDWFQNDRELRHERINDEQLDTNKKITKTMELLLKFQQANFTVVSFQGLPLNRLLFKEFRTRTVSSLTVNSA